MKNDKKVIGIVVDLRSLNFRETIFEIERVKFEMFGQKIDRLLVRIGEIVPF